MVSFDMAGWLGHTAAVDDDVGQWFTGRWANLKLVLYIGACLAAPGVIAWLVALRFG